MRRGTYRAIGGFATPDACYATTMSDTPVSAADQPPSPRGEMAHKAEAVIYSISTNRTGQKQSGDSVLRYFAEETGGRSFHPFQATDLEQSFSDIANELRHQYFIIYSPTDFALDGSFHKIRVRANVKNTLVRARSGYYAPLPNEQQ